MGKRILVIDDEETLLELIANVLSLKDYDISTHSSVGNIVQLAIDHNPDLIIMDHLMPEKNGDELCHELKSDGRTKHIPVIMSTAQALLKEPTGGDPLFIRPDDFLIKPYELDELTEKVHEWTHK